MENLVRKDRIALGLFVIVTCLSALAWNPAFAASGDGTKLDIEVYVDSPEGQPVYRTPATPYLEVIFGASIDIPANPAQGTGDLYLGLMQPGGTTYTWSAKLGVPSLDTGMQPLVRGLDLQTEGSFSALEVFGEDIRYSFIGNEARGMYMMFALLVPTGVSPGDTSQWIGVDMAPLLVE